MKRNSNGLWAAYRFPVLLLAGIALGSMLGLVLGKRAGVFKPLGDLFLNAMFVVVVPLVFFTIASAVVNMASLKRLGKVMGAMAAVFVLTGLAASVLMILSLPWLPAVQAGTLPLVQPVRPDSINAAEQIVNALTAGDFYQLLSKQNMLALIIFSILFAIGLQTMGPRAEAVRRGITVVSEAMLKMVQLIMYYAPIGLGAYFANLVGDFGPQLLGSYLRTMVFFAVLSLSYFFGAFTLYSYIAAGWPGVKRFWRNIITPALTALGTSSSTATLPVNLEAARRMGVPADIREMVLPFGTTTHMEGSCLSGILKIAFLFALFQTPFSGLGTYLSAVLISVIGGVMLSGVPGGGLVGELLIINIYGFPPEAFPIIVTLGFLVDPLATMVNASGDSCSAMLVTRIVEGRGWLKKESKG